MRDQILVKTSDSVITHLVTITGFTTGHTHPLNICALAAIHRCTSIPLEVRERLSLPMSLAMLSILLWSGKSDITRDEAKKFLRVNDQGSLHEARILGVRIKLEESDVRVRVCFVCRSDWCARALSYTHIRYSGSMGAYFTPDVRRHQATTGTPGSTQLRASVVPISWARQPARCWGSR